MINYVLQIHIATKVDYCALNQVRIVPIDHYVIEVVYEKEETDYGLDSNAIAAIDLGIDNLANLTSNQPGFVPVLVSGRHEIFVYVFWNYILKSPNLNRECI